MPSNLFLRCLPENEKSYCTNLLLLTSWSAIPWKSQLYGSWTKMLRGQTEPHFSLQIYEAVSPPAQGVVLCFAERICWLAVVGFICLSCILFTGSFLLIVFCCSPSLWLWQHLRGCAAAEVKVFWWYLHLSRTSKDLQNLWALLLHLPVGTILAVSLGNIRSFWSSNGEFHLPKSLWGTPVKVIWALISNK